MTTVSRETSSRDDFLFSFPSFFLHRLPDVSTDRKLLCNASSKPTLSLDPRAKNNIKTVRARARKVRTSSPLSSSSLRSSRVTEFPRLFALLYDAIRRCSYAKRGITLNKLPRDSRHYFYSFADTRRLVVVLVAQVTARINII